MNLTKDQRLQKLAGPGPDLRELELLKLEKDLEQVEVELFTIRRRLRAVITGDRKGKGPKVVRIDMGNGKTREVKCGTLGE
jgi:hypothetical protein